MTGQDRKEAELKKAGQERYLRWIAENEGGRGRTDRTKAQEGAMPTFLFVLLCGGADRRNAFAGRRLRSMIKRQSGGRFFMAEWMPGAEHTLAELWRILSDSGAEYVIFLTEADFCAGNGWAELRLPSVRPCMIYGDEDRITLRGKRRFSPFFKPDWSPDLLLELRYAGQACAYRRELCMETLSDMERDGAFALYGTDGGRALRECFLYDFVLRFTEKLSEEQILHIPRILNHCIAEYEGQSREEPDASARVKASALKRRGISGYTEPVPDMHLSRVVYEPAGAPKVSVIIPSKDHVGLFAACLASIEKSTSYAGLEIVLVDNGSSPENRAALERLCSGHSVRYLYEPMAFNFARMCNLGAARAEGEFLLFLNDDIEATGADWLERMLGQAGQPHTGAVGAKLYYPGGRLLQHAGVINVGMGPSHALLGKDDTAVHYYGRNRLDYNCLAVTAACMMVEKRKFEQVGGFDEAFAVAFNDVELCFRLREAGYQNVLRNDVCLVHHESASRGSDFRDEGKLRRLIAERTLLWEKHPLYADGRDPFYSVHLAPDRTDFVCRLDGNTMQSAKPAGSLRKPERFEAAFQVHIDEAYWDKEWIIRGWYYWKNDRAMAGARPYLVLMGADGRAVCFAACRTKRRDVAEALGVSCQECGFSCRIRPEELPGKKNAAGIPEEGDMRVLRIGLLLKTGIRRLLCWSTADPPA